MNVDRIERVEEKYLITEKEKKLILKSILPNLKKDRYFSEEVLSLYFDTNNNDLVIKSIDRPPFREKIRVRAYNTPTKQSKIFLEVKSKLSKGPIKIGNKRRLILSYEDLYCFREKKESLVSILNKNKITDKTQFQIAKELQYLISTYKLEPKVLIASDRIAYSSKDSDIFRLTFDKNLRYRTNNLKIEEKGKYISFFNDSLDKKCIIMEAKTMNSMPIWFVKTLSNLKIYPSRFSKYGKIYQKIAERNKNV